MLTLSDQQAAQICGGASLVNISIPIVTSISLGTNIANSQAIAFGGPASNMISQSSTVSASQMLRSRLA